MFLSLVLGNFNATDVRSLFFYFSGSLICNCRSYATANNVVRVIQTLRCTCLLTSWSGDQAVKTTNKSWHRTLFVFSLILISYSSRPLYAADQKSRPNIIQVFSSIFREETAWMAINPSSFITALVSCWSPLEPRPPSTWSLGSKSIPLQTC